MEGRFCRLEALVPQRHAEDLFAVNTLDTDDRNWTYLPYGRFRFFQELPNMDGDVLSER